MKNTTLRTLETHKQKNLLTTQTNVVVTCEIKLYGNNFKNISVFYFTCNHRSW